MSTPDHGEGCDCGQHADDADCNRAAAKATGEGFMRAAAAMGLVSAFNDEALPLEDRAPDDPQQEVAHAFMAMGLQTAVALHERVFAKRLGIRTGTAAQDMEATFTIGYMRAAVPLGENFTGVTAPDDDEHPHRNANTAQMLALMAEGASWQQAVALKSGWAAPYGCEELLMALHSTARMAAMGVVGLIHGDKDMSRIAAKLLEKSAKVDALALEFAQRILPAPVGDSAAP